MFNLHEYCPMSNIDQKPYLGCERKMAPVKGPSFLETFSSHEVTQRVMVMMVHFHPVIHVVMHAFVHHRSVLSHCGCRDRDGGQRGQNVRNLLHLNSP